MPSMVFVKDARSLSFLRVNKAGEDLLGDGTHPSPSGREKVAAMLLTFMKDDPLAQSCLQKPALNQRPCPQSSFVHEA